MDSAGHAAIRLRRDAMAGRGWSMDGGASLTTYYIGLCLDEFRNEFVRWLRKARREVADPRDPAELPDLADQTDLEDAVAVADELRRCLARLSPKRRTALLLQALGLRHDEIGQRMGVSARAVEGLIRRARRDLQREREA